MSKALIAAALLALGAVSLLQQDTTAMAVPASGVQPALETPAIADTVALRRSRTATRRAAVRHRGVAVRAHGVASAHRRVAVRTRQVAVRPRPVAARGARGLGKGKAQRPLGRDQLQGRIDQRLFEIAVVIAPAPVPAI